MEKIKTKYENKIYTEKNKKIHIISIIFLIVGFGDLIFSIVYFNINILILLNLIICITLCLTSLTLLLINNSAKKSYDKKEIITYTDFFDDHFKIEIERNGENIGSEIGYYADCLNFIETNSYVYLNDKYGDNYCFSKNSELVKLLEEKGIKNLSKK